MKYLRRRKLNGEPVKRVTVVLSQKKHADLLRLKGTMSNSEAVEKLIDEKKATLTRPRRAAAVQAAAMRQHSPATQQVT